MQRTTRTYRTDSGGYGDPRRGPQLIRWGAVFGGTVVALGLLVLLASFWFALAYGSETAAIRDNLEWYLGGSAIFCLFVGGILAGWLSGVRGWGPGFINGVTIWALLLIVTFSVGVPSTLNVFSLGRISSAVTNGAIVAPGVDTALWASFWSLLIGFFTAAIGGAIGGALTRPAEVYGPGRGTEATYEEEDEDPTVTRRTRAS
jgi:hypothetical protein